MKITKTQIARHLRQEQTDAEMKLWEVLRNRQFENLKFRRQHPLKDYIVDFYCDELELVIELDGGYHNHPSQRFNDEQRDYHLSFLGYKILRYRNSEVYKGLVDIYKDIQKVKDQSPSQRERVGVRDRMILSTKNLTPIQKKPLEKTNISLTEYDAISVKHLDFKIPKGIENVIFTSQNAVDAFFKQNPSKEDLATMRCFCVGEKTKALLVKNGLKMVKTAQYGVELADFIVEKHKNERFHFFCGNIRSDDIPSALKKAEIELFEVKTYETALNPVRFDKKWDGILFFSPSGVRSFTSENKIGNSLCICIGTTTASEAKKYTDKVVVSETTTIESVIDKITK
ncbi:uroporphyrinogen-III synthase [Ulvibacter antarcticus]|uniref:Uroporphyrinogen-III synthase n=1 Tax=Ulvibacter antarcticus TaxID=442714 RepID=A0A3L9Z683_9FLAO|nr:uroporphyrinogen-III synthase [Ulvibacter antarcticus]RMA65908.1 uroporphyrinogen-III synthase [Ulvibacter antarcticus]